jgi:hypothetical protein
VPDTAVFKVKNRRNERAKKIEEILIVGEDVEQTTTPGIAKAEPIIFETRAAKRLANKV